MSILDLYNKSKDSRVVQARSIPFQPQNYFDAQKKYFSGFELNAQPGDPTEFTAKALDEFDTEYGAKVRPSNFMPDTPFDQYSPDNVYNIPGAPGSN